MARVQRTQDQLTHTSYNSNNQAPSMGLIVGDRGVSQPAGGYFSYNAPPSHTDVARRHKSHKGRTHRSSSIRHHGIPGVLQHTMEFLKAQTLLLVILSLTGCSPISAHNKGGYWPTWAQDSFPPSDIETAYFTHVYYAFLSPNEDTFQFDIDGTTATALTSFNTALHGKNPPVKTLFSIGGGSAGTQLFSNMASSPSSRASFITSAIQVARQYGFDGADLDWEYPQTQAEMDNFGLLLDEWRVAINEEAESTGTTQLLLSAATYYKPTIPWDVVHTYPVASINKNLDWINAMCYDYHGSWTPNETGTLAALYDPNGDVSTSDGLQSWIDSGIQRQKLVMGMPLYGRTWTLQDPTVDGIGAPAVGIGPGNEGAMLYSEVQQFNAQNNAKVVFDEPTVSYYSVAGTSWIGYDDVESVQTKVEYAQSLNIGGYFFWTVIGDQEWKISQLASQTWIALESMETSRLEE